MRGKVTDQDLTNYALNELPPEERLYVESMLAVSEECRHDVYQMLDLSEMLKEGFEREESGVELLLNDEQRDRVLDVPRFHWRGFFQRAAAVALLGAGVAYTVAQPGVWKQGGAADQIATAGQAVSDLVVGIRDKGFARSADELTARMLQVSAPAVTTETSDPAEFQFVSASTPMPAVCTPPFLEMAAMPEVAEM